MYTFRLPQDFLIGTAHSAFQSEGAWDRDGKSMSMMDHYARQFAGKPFPAPPMAAKKAKARLITTDLPNDGCFFYDNYEACRCLYSNLEEESKNNRAFKVIRKKVIEKIDELDVTKESFRLCDHTDKDDLFN